jgi:hypothetical protein
MIHLRTILLFFILSTFASHCLLGQRGGESIFGILHLTPSARMNAMGGHQVALYDEEPSNMLFNPALADSSFHQKISLGFSPYIADISYGYGSFAWNIPSTGTFFAGINHLGYGKMIMADNEGVTSGEFTASESVVFLGFSKDLSPLWTAGLTIKPVISTIETYHSWGMAFDIGVHYKHPTQRLQFGALLRNSGHQLSAYNDADLEALTPDLQVGFSTRLAHAPFRFSATARDLLSGSIDYQLPENDYGINVSQPESANAGFGDLLLRHLVFGVEFVPSNNFYVAAGLNPRRRQELKVDSRASTVGYSWGFGIRIYKFNFSYSSARYHLASTSNHFTISTNLSHF